MVQCYIVNDLSYLVEIKFQLLEIIWWRIKSLKFHCCWIMTFYLSVLENGAYKVIIQKVCFEFVHCPHFQFLSPVTAPLESIMFLFHGWLWTLHKDHIEVPYCINIDWQMRWCLSSWGIWWKFVSLCLSFFLISFRNLRVSVSSPSKSKIPHERL